MSGLNSKDFNPLQDDNYGLTNIGQAYVGGQTPSPSMGLGDTSFNQLENFDFGAVTPGYQPSISGLGGFDGFAQNQMKTDGSFASIGSGVGALAGGPVGSAVGAVGGTAVDMYMSYQANEERKKADRQRLEEARRQQQFSNRQADRDRALAASQYEDSMGFKNADEGRTQESHELNTKQTRLNMLRDAMNNSMKNNDTVRSIFAKRGVI
tara:strand:+ start:592 stop:1218 length:627 start_codon:yes stop_codon:yes gene_type:complete